MRRDSYLQFRIITADTYDELTENPTTGFRVKGYFDESTQNQFTDVLPRLGGIAEIESYLNDMT